MEEKSQVRHEFINGKLYEMPGGSMLHEKIIMNLMQIFLGTTDLEVFAQGLRVRPPETADYYYPDIVITAEKVAKVFHVEAPLFIAEVLSPSTRVNDLVDKFIAYRRFPSLHYYLLAEVEFFQITLFYKNEKGEWESALFRQAKDMISLENLQYSYRFQKFIPVLNGRTNTKFKQAMDYQ